MTAPTWESVATAANTSSETSIVCNAPAGIAPGNVLIAVLGFITGANVVTAPTGWTSILRTDSGGLSDIQIESFWKRATDSEPATYTFTFSVSTDHATAEIHRVSGAIANPPGPIDAQNGNPDSAADPVAPSVTTNFADALLLACSIHDHAAAQTNAAPAGYTERTDFESVNVTRLGSSTATKTQAAAGASGTATFDCNQILASDYVTQHIAVMGGTFVSIAESPAIAVASAIAATVSVTESLSETPTLALTNRFGVQDAVAASEAVSLFAQASLTDAMTIAEAMAIFARLDLSESVTAAEAVALRTLLGLTDAFTLADALAITARLSLSEANIVVSEQALVIFTPSGITDMASAVDIGVVDDTVHLEVSEGEVVSFDQTVDVEALETVDLTTIEAVQIESVQ